MQHIKPIKLIVDYFLTQYLVVNSDNCSECVRTQVVVEYHSKIKIDGCVICNLLSLKGFNLWNLFCSQILAVQEAGGICLCSVDLLFSCSHWLLLGSAPQNFFFGVFPWFNLPFSLQGLQCLTGPRKERKSYYHIFHLN